MLNRNQTTFGIVTIVSTIFIFIYNRTSINNKNLSHYQTHNDLPEYSKEFNELRHDMNDLKNKIYYIEQTITSSKFSNTFILWIQNIFSYFTFLSSSFIIYTVFLYLFHLCVFNTSTTQTIKLLHIVNIISYSAISILYTSLKQFHLTNFAWLLFVFLFVRLCIR
ncbi:unnamed protein product [Adineta steineri]|uniref:Uncharacterized protein n=1 Tax=Adineta steineri TaxID=433720 RepID=A0A814AGW5_9BILA|nr:unnamed protein product [Adineta steineri]CAF0914355.1 unnamed protein product [Adineta steineri]CAF0947140.1 unnamed protein product [Adineta steineri]CAF3712805.1 unnamed protein product [Adineta steineri]CAF3872093.1 unnamed protein product [Adineta steineri]